MIVKPFQQQSRYTTMDNFIIDHIMPKISGSAWKVLTVIIRKTVGWHKECDELSFNQIKQLTGLKSDTTVSEALKDLEKLGVVEIDRPDLSGDDPARFWKSNIYALNLDFEVEVDSGDKIPIAQESTPPTLKNGVPPPQKIENPTPKIEEPPTPKNGDTKERVLKEIDDKGNGILSPAQQMFSVLSEVLRWDPKLMQGRLNKAGKELREAGRTAIEIKAFGAWWYEYDWRGKNKQPPTLSQLKETWGQFKAFQEKQKPASVSPDSPEPEKAELTPEEIILAEFKARAAAVMPTTWKEHVAPMRLADCSGGRIRIEVSRPTKELIEGRYNRVLDPIAQELSPGGFEYVVI